MDKAAKLVKQTEVFYLTTNEGDRWLWIVLFQKKERRYQGMDRLSFSDSGYE
jgi:hypothetical protein